MDGTESITFLNFDCVVCYKPYSKTDLTIFERSSCGCVGLTQLPGVPGIMLKKKVNSTNEIVNDTKGRK